MKEPRAQRLLSELDYLTTSEAAEYCRVSESQFRECAPAMGIRPFKMMGKVLYRKADLKSLLENAWQQSSPARAHQGARSGI